MYKKHPKIRRILALAGAILLAVLYLSTLVLALFDSTDTMMFFKASILSTIIVPVLLWAYTFTFRLTRGNNEEAFPPAGETEEENDRTDEENDRTDEENNRTDEENNRTDEENDSSCQR